LNKLFHQFLNLTKKKIGQIYFEFSTGHGKKGSNNLVMGGIGGFRGLKPMKCFAACGRWLKPNGNDYLLIVP
jgi:hypothetical protein